ncbi:MAG: lipocalin family protein [Bacteroidales bacterium]
MMNRIFPGIAMIAIILLSLTGCETDNKTLLTNGVWKFSNMTTDSEDQDIIAFVTLGKAILTDGTLEINADETYILSAPLLQNSQTGTWSLVGEDQLIFKGEDNITSTANIETLSKKELKYIETYVDAEMNSYSITTSWSRD